MSRFDVYDADTVYDLNDKGRRRSGVRATGIDAPERRPNEPGQSQSTQVARNFLLEGYQRGEKVGETYGRDLAPIKDQDGQTLSNHLLRTGMADPVSTTMRGQTLDHSASRAASLIHGDDGYGLSEEDEILRSGFRAEREQALLDYFYDADQSAGRGVSGYIRNADKGAVSRAWDRGVAGMKANSSAFVHAVGTTFELEGLQDWSQDRIDAALWDAMDNPADLASFRDIGEGNRNALYDIGLYVVETLAENAPQLLVDLGIGVATGGAGTAITVANKARIAGVGLAAVRNIGGASAAASPGRLAKILAQIGTAGSMYVQMVGDVHQNARDVGAEGGGLDTFALAGINTAAQFASLRGILGDVAGSFGSRQSIESGIDALMSIAGATARSGTREALAEGFTAFTNELNKHRLSDGSYTTDPDVLIDQFLRGGAFGAALAGSGTAVGAGYALGRGSDEAAGGTEPPASESGEAQDDQIERLRRRSWDQRAETTPEGPIDLAGTLSERPTGFVHVSAANAQDGVTLGYLQSQYPGLAMRELPDGSVQVAQSEEGLASAPTDPSEADQADALGYEQSKDEVLAAAAAGQPTTVVRERDVDGIVVRDQIVTEERAADAERAAAEQGHTTERMSPEQAQAERRQRYEDQLAQITGVEVADRSAAPTQIEGERPLPHGAFEFSEERAPADIAPLVEEAAALGIDPSPYRRQEPMVDEAVLRRELASRLREPMPDDPSRTLHEALGGRHLSDLDASQLRQLARAMGMQNLPQPLRAVEGDRTRFRDIARSAVARKLGDWKRGARQATDGKVLDAISPSDMSLLSVLVPELRGLARRNFSKGAEGAAQYQAAVRRALPEPQALRQRLAGMDDAQLWQAVQLTRTEDAVTENRDGFALDLGTEERVDVGALSRAVDERRQTGESGSRNTREEADARVGELVLGMDASEIEGSESPVDPFLLQDAAQAAAAAAAYAQLSGESEGGNVQAVLQAQAGSLSAEELGALRPGALDGAALIRSVVASEVRPDQAESRTRDWQQLALTSPTEFAREFGAALLRNNVPLDNFLADGTRPSGNETRGPAQGTQTRNSPTSREPGPIGGMDYSTLEGRGEQEKSDGLFFIGLLDGARFGVNEEGGMAPAGRLDPASDSPMHKQRVTSVERTERLDGRNLMTVPVRNRRGQEETWAFDAVALAEYGQPGQPRPETAADAFFNLLANFSRMIEGSAALALQPDGPNASYVQALNSDVISRIPGDKVIWEKDGQTVTFAEAEQRYFQGLRDRNAVAELANQADRLREVQRSRREAMRVLLMRAMNGIDSPNLTPDQRLARIKAINDVMYQALDGDQLVDETRRVTGHMDEVEQAAWRALGETRQETLASEQAQLEAAVASAQGRVAEAARRVEENREGSDYEREAADNALSWAEYDLRRLESRLVLNQQSQRTLADSLAHLPTEVSTEAADLRNVRTGDLGRFALTDAEAARVGDTGGLLSLEALRTAYSNTRSELRTITDVLQRSERTASDSDIRVDAMAREFMDAGMAYDEAHEAAQELAERTDGITGRETGTEGEAAVADGPLTDEDGNAFDATLDSDGLPRAAPIYNDTQDADSETGTSALDERMGREWQELQAKIAKRNEEHEAKVAAFKEAHADNPDVNMADAPEESLFQVYPTPLRRSDVGFGTLSRMQRRGVWTGAHHPQQRGVGDGRTRNVLASAQEGAAARVRVDGQGEVIPRYQPGPALQGDVSAAHANARQRLAEARRAQATGIPLPVDNRAKVLDRVFGDKGMRVLGAVKAATGDVEAFIGQALKDFRSTDRPVLVTAGQTAQEISTFINQNNLLPANRRKAATRVLIEAQAGSRALYMPMGDFVLVSLPSQPKTGDRKANLRWYHQLGHELGHLVFDDYAASLDHNRALRTQVHTAYQAETGLEPRQDEGLYKEWFANQAANEMITRAFGQADPEQMTPFTRLANLMQGLWERIQYLIPEMTRSRSFGQFAEAIRQGQIKRNRDDATPDFGIEFYGGNALDGARLKRSADKLREGVKKASAKGSVIETSARLVRTVVGRIESYNTELANRLFQRSATDRSQKGVAAFQQFTNAARDRYTGAMHRTFTAIEAGAKGKKAKAAAVEQAFRDLEAGRRTKGAQLLATFIDGVITDAEKNGLRSLIHRDDFVPVAMNHEALDSRRQEFTELLKAAFPEESDAHLQQRLEVLLDTNGFSQYAVAPGVPVSMHDTTNRLIDHHGPEALRQAGFLNERSDAVLYHWLEGVAKRTAWEANFGGYTRDVTSVIEEHQRMFGEADLQGERAEALGLRNAEGMYWDASGEYKQLMEQVVAEHGVQAQADIESMLDGVMGRKTSRMPRGIRQINDWITAWTSWTVLLFSGIASIPEVGLPAVRAHGRVGILDGLRGFPEAWRMAKDMGVVMTDSAERIIWQTMGDNYESSTLNKIGNAFFKYNGQKIMTDVNRAMGVSFGQRYLIKSAEIGDTQALAQLGVTDAEVRAWDSAGRPSWQPGINTANNAVAEKVQAAINQFVYEGSSMPSKFQNPSWFNNPYLKVFWMIKRYMYAYGEGILMGMWRQGKRQWMRGSGLAAEQRAFLAVAPALMFAIATIPLAALGTELREWMRPYTTGRPGKDIDDFGGSRKYAEYLFSRAGGFGPLEMLLSARQQSEWGYSPIGSISPVAAKAEMWMDWGADGRMSQGEFLTKLRQSLPVFSQMPRAWNAMVDAVAN